MTDLRKLLSEARAAIESLEAIIEGEISRDWSDIFYADWLIADKAKSRIDAALAEKVGPVAEFMTLVNHGKTPHCCGCYYLKIAEGVLWLDCNECGHLLQFTPDEAVGILAAPADQWRRVEDGLPEVLFDGYSVFTALSDQAKTRTSAENVSDTLDAVVRLMRNALPESDK